MNLAHPLRMADTIEYEGFEETLVATANELLAAGHVDEALEACAAVLRRSSDDAAALELFARAAEQADLDSWSEGGANDTSQVRRLQLPSDRRAYRRRVLRFIENKRYEAALLLLTQGQRRFPEDEAIARSVSVVRDHLTARYRRRLDPLSSVPERASVGSPRQDDIATMLSFVDGETTFEELIHASPKDRFHTLRMLHRLLREGYIRIQREPEYAPTESLAPDSIIGSSDTLSLTALLLVRTELAAHSDLPAPPPVGEDSLTEPIDTDAARRQLAASAVHAPTPKPRPKRSRWGSIATGVIVVLTLGLGAAALVHGSGASDDAEAGSPAPSVGYEPEPY